MICARTTSLHQSLMSKDLKLHCSWQSRNAKQSKSFELLIIQAGAVQYALLLWFQIMQTSMNKRPKNIGKVRASMQSHCGIKLHPQSGVDARQAMKDSYCSSVPLTFRNTGAALRCLDKQKDLSQMSTNLSHKAIAQSDWSSNRLHWERCTETWLKSKGGASCDAVLLVSGSQWLWPPPGEPSLLTL